MNILCFYLCKQSTNLYIFTEDINASIYKLKAGVACNVCSAMLMAMSVMFTILF